MPVPWHFRDDRLRVRKFCVGPYENNVYLVACARTGEAVIIDAAAEAERIMIEVRDVEPQAVLTTHGHHDHVQAAGVAGRLGVPFAIHPEDASMAGLEPDLALQHGQEIPVGELVLRARHTPGHTPGSTCLVLAGHAFTGDTLFPGGPGATRGREAFRQVMGSLEQELFTLPEETLAHPGHGLDTTIGTERPHLREWSERGW